MIEEAARRLAEGRKTLLVGPSIAALEEYKARAAPIHPCVTFELYHSQFSANDSSGPVRVDVEQVLDNRCAIGGRIACITHATFQNLDPSKQWPEWDVFIDEALDVYQPVEKNLHESHRVVTNGLKAISSGAFYSTLEITDRSLLRGIAEDRNKDLLIAELKSIAGRLLNDNYTTYTITSAYRKLLSKGGRRKKLYAYSVFTSRAVQRFGSVTVLSARFDESLHFHVWKREGVEWVEDRELMGRLNFQSHRGYSKLTIHYGYERNFSKSLRDRNPDSYASLVHRAIGAVSGKDFIRLENNDVKFTSVLSQTPGGKTIEGRSNGLNCYRQFDNAIIIPALNYTSQASDFLSRQYGIDKEMQSIGFACHSIYQAASRTSMRDGDLSIERNWVVPTKRQAQWLSDVMGGSSIVSLGLNDQPEAGKSGRPKRYADGNARKAKGNRDKRNRDRQANEFEDQIADNVFQDVPFLDANSDVVNSIIDKREIVALFRSSLFANLWDMKPHGLVMKPNEFVRFLKRQAKAEYEKKHDIPLISPAFFNPTIVPETSKGKRNTMFASGIMLDLDGTDIKPLQFADIFPELKIVLYNTYSNRPGDLRYRAYFDTTRPTTISEYKAIIDALIARIEDEGYVQRPRGTAKPRESVMFHGIDMSKRGPYSHFHLPCQAKDDSRGSSFIKEFTGPDRSPLDVNGWIRALPFVEEENDRAPPSYSTLLHDSSTLTSVQDAGISDALSDWYRYGVMPGNGCDGMLELYSKLCRLRIPDNVWTDLLYQAARSASSPEDRRRQVADLIATRKRYLGIAA
ncbi:hypothetical protein [Methylobacterium sp. Leaf125]|uniref:hypothetical protein n=1 Tax=Methylobacterium sp. Leaf125 TaxID=1736265 RepID=UPI000B22D52D|nr:hypothetical protein [Methylobacterium sp. Leaf125]